MSSSNHSVFVYGTLKRGFYNHYVLDESKLILDRARTKYSWFHLSILGDYHIPYLQRQKNCGSKIFGQVYAVNDEVLSKLDILEGVPDHYIRERVQVDGSNEDAWIYIKTQTDQDILHTIQSLSEYTLNDHKRYIPPPLRGKTYQLEGVDEAFSNTYDVNLPDSGNTLILSYPLSYKPDLTSTSKPFTQYTILTMDDITQIGNKFDLASFDTCVAIEIFQRIPKILHWHVFRSIAGIATNIITDTKTDLDHLAKLCHLQKATKDKQTIEYHRY